MVRKYFRIEEIILKLTEVDNYLPSFVQRNCLESVLAHFCNFESIAKHLKAQGMMPNNARFLLNRVCDDCQGISKYLFVDLLIIHGHPFENATVKFMDGNDSQLTATEQATVKALAVQSGSMCKEDGRSSSTYIKRIKAIRRSLSSTGNRYISCWFIPATSCTVKCLFSAARWIKTCLRKNMSQILLESLLLLNLNRKYWDLKMVSAAMKIQTTEGYVSLDSDELYEDHDFLI